MSGGLMAVRNRQLEPAPEMRLRPQKSRLDKSKDRPQSAQRILDRRPRQCQPVLCMKVAHNFRNLRTRVLRVLCLIENQRPERLPLELLRIEPRQRIRGNDDVVLIELGIVRRALRARLQPQRGEHRGKPLDLSFPRMRNRCRRNDERRCGPVRFFAME